jgi:hypothetical protein
MKNRIRRRYKQFAAFLASTIFAVTLLASPALALTRNQAEGLANAQASSDCSSFLWRCIYEDVSECHDTGTNTRGVVQWWCTEIVAQQNKITGYERIGSRALGYGPYGGAPLVKPNFDWQPFGGGA